MLPCWLSDKQSACQCRRHRFEPWSGKIPHAIEQFSLCATIIEPVLQSPGTTTIKPTGHSYWSLHALEPSALQQQKPPQWEAHALQLECNPCLPQWGKSPNSNKDTAQPKMLLLLLSHFRCVRLCATPQTAAHQASPHLGFSRQGHWSGLPFPSPAHEGEKWKWSRSVVSDSATTWTAAYQVPPSMGFSRQEYWSGMPLPSPQPKIKIN